MGYKSPEELKAFIESYEGLSSDPARPMYLFTVVDIRLLNRILSNGLNQAVFLFTEKGLSRLKLNKPRDAIITIELAYLEQPNLEPVTNKEGTYKYIGYIPPQAIREL